MRHVLEIAKRDFLQRAKSKAFLVTSGITVVLVLAIGPVVTFFGGDDSPELVGFVGRTPSGLEEMLGGLARLQATDVEIVHFQSVSTAEDALGAGRVDVVIVDGEEVVWRKDPRPPLSGVVVGAIELTARTRALEELGLSPEEVEAALRPQPPATRSLEPKEEDDAARRVAAFAGVILLYASIVIFGQFVLLGVLEEKSSRVVEVLLSRVRPGEILAGKILGIGALGFGQLVALGAAAWFTVTQVDLADVSLSGVGLDMLLIVVGWYLLGYAFFAVMFGALGATISRQEDVQGAAMLPILLLLPGYFVALVGLENPGSALVRFTSMIPPTSPLVMPMRQAATTVPSWEVALAVGLIAATAYGLIRVGGRIYTGALLRLGPKVKLREAWRASAR